MEWLDNLNKAYEKLYDSYVKHIELAKDFAQKVEKSDGMSKKTKEAVLALGIAMIVSHFIGD